MLIAFVIWFEKQWRRKWHRCSLDVQTKSLFEFHIPQSCLFTYNGEAKTQIIYKKNVYQNYLSSAAPRSTPEVKFEKFCEHSGNVEWWYKNGDKGSEYFSIVYGDNSEKQKLFYPDYIVGISGEIWIIETKGGFDRSGNSQDIDIYTPKKFEALKAYLDAHGLKRRYRSERRYNRTSCASVWSTIQMTSAAMIGCFWKIYWGEVTVLKILELKSVPVNGKASVQFIRIDPEDISATLSEILKAIMDLSWLKNFDAESLSSKL